MIDTVGYVYSSWQQRNLRGVPTGSVTDLIFIKKIQWYILLRIAGFQCHAIQNKNQNHSIDKVQILRKERR